MQVSGPEATTYLQGQVSQDVEKLAPATSTWTFVLQPTGKVDSWARLTRTADDTFVFDVDGGYGDALEARLRRFLLRTKAEIQSLDWSCIAVRGRPLVADEGTLLDNFVLSAGWTLVDDRISATDILGPTPTSPPGLPDGDPNGYQALRIAAGVPSMGEELTEQTIPAEAGQWVVDQSVDFTKGCFTGQELVARIESRGGNVPRRLRGLILETDVPPPPGAEVQVGGAPVGTVTSAVTTTGWPLHAAAPGPVVALAYIKRSVEPPAAATIAWDRGQAETQIAELPLI